MNPRPVTLRIIDAISFVMLLASAAVSLWPVNISTVPLVSGAVMPSGTPVTVAAAGLASDTTVVRDGADVVNLNILSDTRRAPKARYTSPELLGQLPYTPPAAFAHTPDSASKAGDSTGTGDADAVPAVYGIMNMDGSWRALLRLSTNDESPVMLREGDKRGSYRVVSIASDRVVIANSEGQRTLRLSRTVRGDSTKHKP